MLHTVQTECEERNNADHCQGEIEVRAHSMRSRFRKEAERCCDRDDIRERDREGQSDHAGKFSDLNHRPLGVEGDAETIPTKTAEEPTACPFMRGPRGRSQEGHQRISPRSSERLWS